VLFPKEYFGKGGFLFVASVPAGKTYAFHGENCLNCLSVEGAVAGKPVRFEGRDGETFVSFVLVSVSVTREPDGYRREISCFMALNSKTLNFH